MKIMFFGVGQQPRHFQDSCPHAQDYPKMNKGHKYKPKIWWACEKMYLEDEVDHNNVNQWSTILEKENIIFSKFHTEDREEDMKIEISSFKMVVVNESPLRGIKRLHEFDTSYFDKELTI